MATGDAFGELRDLARLHVHHTVAAYAHQVVMVIPWSRLVVLLTPIKQDPADKTGIYSHGNGSSPKQRRNITSKPSLN